MCLKETYASLVPPKWVQEPEDVMAVEGQDVLIPCLVEGFPRPEISWTRDDAFHHQPLDSLGFPNGSLLLTTVSVNGRQK